MLTSNKKGEGEDRKECGCMLRRWVKRTRGVTHKEEGRNETRCTQMREINLNLNSNSGGETGWECKDPQRLQEASGRWAFALGVVPGRISPSRKSKSLTWETSKSGGSLAMLKQTARYLYRRACYCMI